MDKKHILVIEDDRSIIELLQVTLTEAGFLFSFATDGDSARDRLSETKPDIIIIDMMLPNTNGFEILKSLQSKEHGNVPVFVISGALTDEEFRRMILFEPNVKEYLTKPLKIDLLLSKIYHVLDIEPSSGNS